jgi:hypothetical protein
MEVIQVVNVLFQQFIVFILHQMVMVYFGIVLMLVQFILFIIQLNMTFVVNQFNINGLNTIFVK